MGLASLVNLPAMTTEYPLRLTPTPAASRPAVGNAESRRHTHRRAAHRASLSPLDVVIPNSPVR